MGIFPTLRLLFIGSLVYPAVRGERIAAGSGICLSLIGIGVWIVWLNFYPPPPRVRAEQLWLSTVGGTLIVLWLITATVYKGAIIWGRQISILGLTGLLFVFGSFCISWVERVTDGQPFRTWDISVYEWVAIGGVSIANSWIDFFLLMAKMAREDEQRISEQREA